MGTAKALLEEKEKFAEIGFVDKFERKQVK